MYFLSLFLMGQFRRCMMQLLCSRLTTLQKSIKDRPLARMEHPVRPIVMSQSRPERPKKRVTFSSSSIVFIITNNEAYPLDITSEYQDVQELNVIQVRPLWHLLQITMCWHILEQCCEICNIFDMHMQDYSNMQKIEPFCCVFIHTDVLIGPAVMQHTFSVRPS